MEKEDEETGGREEKKRKAKGLRVRKKEKTKLK